MQVLLFCKNYLDILPGVIYYYWHVEIHCYHFLTTAAERPKAFSRLRFLDRAQAGRLYFRRFYVKAVGLSFFVLCLISTINLINKE